MTVVSHLKRVKTQIRKSFAAPIVYTPAQLAGMYDYPIPKYDGTGCTVGFIELGGGYSPPDSNCTVILVGGATNSPDGPDGADGEIGLDDQVVAKIAPGAKRRIYIAPNTTAGFAAAIRQARLDGCNKISISWGGPEDAWTPEDIQTMETELQACYAAGIDVYVAAGDSGSGDGESGNHVDYPSSSVYVIACGGTTLTSSAETVWNDGSQGGATGGGISSLFGQPAYQAGIGAPSNTMRCTPDVAGDADPNTGYGGYSVDGVPQSGVGGTSAVAPLWTALSALCWQAGAKRLGNAQIYAMSKQGGILRDITIGNNGTYTAKAGYDCCTGCGSPDGEKILVYLLGSPTPTPGPVPTPTPAPTPTPTPIPAPPTLTLQQQVDAILMALMVQYARNPIVLEILTVAKGLIDAYLQSHRYKTFNPHWSATGLLYDCVDFIFTETKKQLPSAYGPAIDAVKGIVEGFLPK